MRDFRGGAYLSSQSAFRGFTLAEVLITLGVIGVVAAMTMPVLINNIQGMQYRSAYKKAYSAISQALLFAISDSKILPVIITSVVDGTPRLENLDENFKTISTYFKTVKTCFDDNANECWVCEDGQAGFYGSSPPDYLGCSEYSYAFIDNSGFAWYLYFNNEYPILVDVNGDRKPNKLGKDRFVMYFSNQAGEKYAQEVNRILPWEDTISKGRWCPSGNCLYKSWLLK